MQSTNNLTRRCAIDRELLYYLWLCECLQNYLMNPSFMNHYTTFGHGTWLSQVRQNRRFLPHAGRGYTWTSPAALSSLEHFQVSTAHWLQTPGQISRSRFDEAAFSLGGNQTFYPGKHAGKSRISTHPYHLFPRAALPGLSYDRLSSDHGHCVRTLMYIDWAGCEAP